MYPGFMLREESMVNCANCNHPMANALGSSVSAFMVAYCHNTDCRLDNCPMLVEKATMLVLLPIGWKLINGEPAWPSHWANRKNEQVLPEVIS